jgi:uncharacterized cupredoxin-like copper-binding protein
MTKRLLLMTLIAAFGLVVVACGGGQPAAPSGDTTATEGAAGGETAGGAAPSGETAVTVKTLDTLMNGFDPADVTASAGQTVNLTLDNSGQALEHSWVLLSADETKESAVTIQQTGDEDRKQFELQVQPGATASGSFQAPSEPGTYVVVCHIPGHAAAGMLGTLTVEP